MCEDKTKNDRIQPLLLIISYHFYMFLTQILFQIFESVQLSSSMEMEIHSNPKQIKEILNRYWIILYQKYIQIDTESLKQ